MLDNVDFSPCYSWLMTNIYLEVRLSVFSYLMQHLAGSSVIQLTMRGVFFFFPLYDILILSQLCKLNSCVILLLSIKNHQFQILTVTYVYTTMYFSFYDYQKFKELQNPSSQRLNLHSPINNRVIESQ